MGGGWRWCSWDFGKNLKGAGVGVVGILEKILRGNLVQPIKSEDLKKGFRFGFLKMQGNFEK